MLGNDYNQTSSQGRPGILTWTRKSVPEPTRRYPIRNRTKTLQVFLGLNLFYRKKLKGTNPNKPGPEKNRPEYIRPDKNRFVHELKTYISKTMIFCVLLYIYIYIYIYVHIYIYYFIF